MMKNKRGQYLESPTVHVAVFVVMLALFIVAYLILLPSSEREKLLGTGEEYEPEGAEEEEGLTEKETILSVYPGNVYPYSRETDTKNLASVNIYSTLQSTPVMLATNVIVTKNLLMNNYKELEFGLENLDNLENLGLFFNTGEAKGELIVKINDNEIYRGKVLGGDLPVRIPAEYLKESNKLILEVSSPGWMILATNKFTLKDVQLIKQISKENRVELRSFVVDDTENLRKGSLGFFINCLKIRGEQGTLKISLNGKNIYIGRIVCDAGFANVDLIKDNFVNGRNTLAFEIDTGEYSLEQVKIELETEKEKVPQYFFSVDEKEEKYILKINFEESSEIKRATVTINGDNIYVDEYANSYKKDITEFIREGENYIKIIAKNEFTIDLLEITQGL